MTPMVDFAENMGPTETYAVLCYLPPAGYIGLDRFADNMQQMPTSGRVIYYSDTNSDVAKRLGARKVDPIPAGNMQPVALDQGMRLPPSMSWVPSSYAFLDAARIAIQERFDWFFYLETDCRVSRPYWDSVLWAEHQRGQQGIVASGTPVVWNPWTARSDWKPAISSYALRYRKLAGCALPYCGPNRAPVNVYPNGALAFYNVREVREAFSDALAGPPRGPAALNCMPFDYHFGKHLIRKYGLDVFKKIGFLPSSYSGCGNILMPELKRIEMLTNKTKVAVHQIKSNDI